MARAIWTGSLAFGLVNVPVGLYSATEDKTIHFNQFQKGTSARIRYRRVNEETGEEVPYSEIVKGHDIGGGQFVILTREELEEVEPGRSRTIDISDFVDATEIDPIYYQKTYYLAPNGEGADRAYGLLLQALGRADRVGIATFVMRSKQYLAAIRPQGDVLTLETMFFADEVRDAGEEITQLPVRESLGKRDLDMAVSLIESMTSEWEPANYRDTYRDRVLELIEAKRNGDEIVTEHEDTGPSNVVDLMEALRASIEASRGHKPGNGDQAQKIATRRAGGGGGGGGGGGRNGDDGDRGGDESGEDELASMSKNELYDLAQDLEISGRSKMNRGELADSIRQARGGQAARKAS